MTELALANDIIPRKQYRKPPSTAETGVERAR
jgi:hypothetical protein